MSPIIASFIPYESLGKPWGTELVIAETPQYLGKVLTMRGGHRGGLQYHERKDESFYLQAGSALVRYDDGTGHLTQTHMIVGQTFHVRPGVVHQVEALEDCIFFEVSTPVHDDRVNVSERYGVGEAGESR